MKTKKLTIAIALMAMTFIGTSCGNKQQKSASEVTTEQSASSALEIDSLLANAENLAGQEVTMRAVKQAGVIVQSQAKLLISSDTGALARSVRVKNEVKEYMVASTVYTNSKYAPYYEFGTGPNG